MGSVVEIPVGTVTFLFTDIQGSTRQWEAHAGPMSVALRRHDDLLNGIIVAHRGYVFKTVGDAFCAAFQTALDGLHATVEIQRTLDAEPWPEPIQMKVRMAVHTGVAEARNGDYFGRTLNRVARLQAAGHGGQILVSLTTWELLRDVLPEGLGLVDVGELRLKDLIRPERAFQVSGPGIDRDFPPLKTLDDQRNNLPIQLTSFIGRDAEMFEVQRLLADSRLVTLAGSGGAGKTRLAIQVGAELSDDFAGGVWLVELAALTEPGQVIGAIAQALSIVEEPVRPLTETVLTRLRDEQMLLILDNCEHLLDAASDVSNVMLMRCPKIKILATSREPLGILGERSYRVPSLSLPHASEQTGEGVQEYASAQLFVDRALLSDPSFTVSEGEAPLLADICRRLDGIPLALELAAARCRSLSLSAIHDRLNDRFRLLTGGSRTSLPRQKTLRALVDWSYDLLSESERALLLRLSVFAGGWTLEMLERIDDDPDVLDDLSSLVDKSLVIADRNAEGHRYRLLMTVREYAVDRLLESGRAEQERNAHRDCFVAFAKEAFERVRGGEQKTWLDRLEVEHDNLRVALQWCVMEGDPEEKGLGMVSDLYRFWWIRGHWTEGRTWVEQLLEIAARRPSTPTQARAFVTLGNFTLYQGHYDLAQVHYEKGLAVFDNLGDHEHVARGWHNLAHVAHLRGDGSIAKPLYEKSIEMWREIGNAGGLAGSLNNLANLCQERHEHEEALALHQEALAVHVEQSNVQGMSQSNQNLGSLAYQTGDIDASYGFYAAALAPCLEIGDVRSGAQVLGGFAEVFAAKGRFEEAAQFLGVSEALRISIGAPLYDNEREEIEAFTATVRDGMSEEAFESAFQRGSGMSFSAAVELALGAEW